MNVTVRIPDDLGARLSAEGADLERRVLEALVLEEFRAGRLSKAELSRALGFVVLNELDGFLKAHGVYEDYTLEELDRDVAEAAAARESETATTRQAATGTPLAAAFREFRRGRTLGAQSPRDLIREDQSPRFAAQIAPDITVLAKRSPEDDAMLDALERIAARDWRG